MKKIIALVLVTLLTLSLSACGEKKEQVSSTGVKKSSAFNRDKNNIGIVEMPLAGKNRDKYPTGWLTAVACGSGKDTRVAIAWDIFRSKYEDGKSDSNAMSKKDKEYVNSLISGNIVCEPASLQDSDNNTNSLGAYYIMPGIRNGADVSKTVNDYKDKITACIKFALNQ